MILKLKTRDFAVEIEDANTNADECGKLFRQVMETLTINNEQVETLEIPHDECKCEESTLTRPRRIVSESPSMRKPEETEERMRLVFFICPNCGDTFCKMINLNNPGEIICKNCDHEIPLDVPSLSFGSYVCPDCSSVGKFLMQPDVAQVKCRGCDNMFYMVQDADTKEYEGKIYR